MNSRDSLAWSPPVRLWLLASVQSAWFGLMERFPRTPALLQPWREYQQVMLRTWTTGAPPVPGSVLGHRSGTSYVNKNPDKTRSAFCDFIPSLLGILLIIFPAECAKSGNNQASRSSVQTGKPRLNPSPRRRSTASHSAAALMVHRWDAHGVFIRWKKDACAMQTIGEWIIDSPSAERQGESSTALAPLAWWSGSTLERAALDHMQCKAAKLYAFLKEPHINNTTEYASLKKQTHPRGWKWDFEGPEMQIWQESRS